MRRAALLRLAAVSRAPLPAPLLCPPLSLPEAEARVRRKIADGSLWREIEEELGTRDVALPEIFSRPLRPYVPEEILEWPQDYDGWPGNDPGTFCVNYERPPSHMPAAGDWLLRLLPPEHLRLDLLARD